MFTVNEIFASLQGEGRRAGTPNVFVRFSGCNLMCRAEVEGFDCDTEFSSGIRFDSVPALVCAITGEDEWDCKSVIFTGGEPTLQVNGALIQALRDEGYFIAIETNGTKAPPVGIDWVSVSPKTAEHTLRVTEADELRYVRRRGQGIPKPAIKASHKFISPAFQPDGSLRRDDLDWCIALVHQNPGWSMSVQQHKLWNVR
jgi:7-carboxy-7-deazaguanine synthase